MHLLVHICCGPCAAYPIPFLQQAGHRLRGYFYNPNVHPYQEHQKRAEGLRQLARALNLEVIWDKDYELEKYLRQVCFREEQRCRLCYHLRLQKTARVARRGGFDGFTTTLLVSPRQKHELIKEAGEQAAAEAGVTFFYQDFRPGYKEAVARSRELNLYRQSYCGCLFSERDRYAPRQGQAAKGGAADE
ncbi:MAG: epoxyqueuosine reductase QueH [Syntrophomonadaceae bacterium]|nr:epoxyqueuosine reductase QueH [Syntrophomonadaceae bacterium]